MRIRLVLVFLFAATVARADFREFKSIPVDPAIATKVRHGAEEALKQFPKLKADDLAISVVDLTNPQLLSRGDYNGDVNFYPASVVKLFFMTDIYLQNKQSL